MMAAILKGALMRLSGYKVVLKCLVPTQSQEGVCHDDT